MKALPMDPTPADRAGRALSCAIVAAVAATVAGLVCAFTDAAPPLGALVPAGLTALAILSHWAARPGPR